MEALTVMKKGKTINAGDIIEVYMTMEQEIPEEDLKETYIIDTNNYDTKCRVVYEHPNNAGWTDVDYIDEAGYCSYIGINDYLEDRVKEDINYLLDYEIFDVYNTDGEYQTAKIRIKALKEV